MSVNDRIKEIRKREDLTLEKFGARLGVGKSVLSQIENGRSNVTDQMIKSICREFRVNEQWLRDGTGEPYVIPDDPDAEILEDIMFDKDNPVYRAALDVLRVYKKLEPEYKTLLEHFAAQLYEQVQKPEE